MTALHQAISTAGAQPAEIATWDLHATATPGDFQEVENLRQVVPDSVLVTARKGTFGHGMGAAGGFELTAQYLAYEHGHLFPTPLPAEELNAEIARAITEVEALGPPARETIFDDVYAELPWNLVEQKQWLMSQARTKNPHIH